MGRVAEGAEGLNTISGFNTRTGFTVFLDKTLCTLKHYPPERVVRTQCMIKG